MLLAADISAANTHDSLALQPLIMGITPIPQPTRPSAVPASQAPRRQRLWLPLPVPSAPREERHACIARRASKTHNAWAGGVGWSNTASWLARLRRRYERRPEHFRGFTVIAATLINHRRLTKCKNIQSLRTGGVQQRERRGDAGLPGGAHR